MDEKTIEFDLSEMSIDDLVFFEEGDKESVRFVRDFLGRFVKGKNGRLPADQGIKIIGAFPVFSVRALQDKFEAQIRSLSSDNKPGGENPTMTGESD